ncbi:baseplate J/gp47 family protein, partial [Patescibacteria group bacterium]|nr:baseplate J/gp47 family protein [Patescibacteria group bacterium]
EKDLSQEFIAHHWSKSLPFLHLPQIQVVPDDFDIRSVMFGAAKQMGFEVMAEFKKETLEEVKEMEGDAFEEHVVSTEKEEIGTMKEDEAEKEEIKKNEPEDEIEEVENMAAFGFMQEDVGKIKPEKQEILEKVDTQDRVFPADEELAFEKADETFSPRKRASSPLERISAMLTSVLAKINIKGLTSKGLPGFKGKTVIIPIALIVLLIVLGAYFAFSKKATINLTLTPKTQEQSEAVTFSLSGNTDPENRLIAVESTSDSQDGSVTLSATGKKETGEPAKGNVTFYSRFTESKTIAAGTVVSANNLDFTTDKEVKIASASADASASPSTASVAVTAKKIGKESNLPSGTKFNVASLSTSDIIAKNDNAFSGGSKKDITIVSKDDYEKLEEKLIKDLEEKAKDSISKKVSSDKNVLPAFIDTTVEDKEFSKKVNDEASQVTLSGTVSYTGLLYTKKDLTDFTKSLIASTAKDLSLDEKNLKVNVTNAKKKNDKQIIADLKITAKLLPKINQEDLIGKIKGLPIKEAEAELRQINQIADVKISISPPLPFISGSMPTSPAQIIFKVSSDE